MLEFEADSGLVPVVTPSLPQPSPAETPDRDVLDGARGRLAFYEALAAISPLAERSTTDLRAVYAVLEAVQAGPQETADPLDVGAGLVLLGNLRLHLDQLEAGLLGTAQQAGVSWDLIAAILGIPAAEALDRLHTLRGRPRPA